jgi:hypothetical protein
MTKNGERIWVISNYQQDPSLVIESLHESYLIYNQGGVGIPAELALQKNCIDSLHSGHNISDYFRFIIDHYECLPERVGFIKGNLFPRHIPKNSFLEREKLGGFIPLYGDSKTFAPQYRFPFDIRLVAQQIAPGYYLEIANDWYVKHRNPGKHYPHLNDLFLHLFGRQVPKYVLFTPGACMVVPRENILRWPLDLYRHLYEVVSYEFFPVEAFHVERSMLYLFDFPKL